MNVIPHVFISHKSEDAQFAQEMRLQLEDNDTAVWIAPDSIPPGEKWDEVIDKAIEEAFALIVILTPQSLQSQWVTYEWSLALFLGKKIFTIKLVNFSDERIHDKLRKVQYQDFTNYETRPEEWRKLVERLKKEQNNYKPNSLTVPMNAPVVIKNAVIGLDSRFTSERMDAIRNLVQLNHPLVVDVLLAASIQHPYRDVRIHAAVSLPRVTKLTDEMALQIIPSLIEAIRNEHSEGFAQAYTLLINLGPLSVPFLINMWKERLPFSANDVIKQILRAIGKPALAGIADVLRDSRDSNEDTRNEAIWLLKDMKDDDAIPSFVHALTDASVKVRLSGVRVLQEYGVKAKSAVPQLSHLLTDLAIPERQHHPIALDASLTLFRIGTPEAFEKVVPYLIQELSNTKPLSPGFGSRRVCDLMAELLSEINTNETIKALEEWQQSQAQDARN